jgi:hypothetical protein
MQAKATGEEKRLQTYAVLLKDAPSGFPILASKSKAPRCFFRGAFSFTYPAAQVSLNPDT